MDVMPTPRTFDAPAGDVGARGPITAAKIRERYDQGSKAIRAEQYQYAINHSFMRGDQWVYHHKTTNTIREVPRDPERVQITANRLWPTSRTILAKLGRRQLTFEVPPKCADDAYRLGAAKAEGAIDDLAVKEDWEALRDHLARITWEAGTAALCEDWDSGAGELLGVDAATGKKVYTGDVRTSVLTVAEIATEPGSRDIERGRWWIKACALPPDQVKATYRLPKVPPADSSAALSPAQQRLLDDDRKDGPSIPLTLVLTYYERPGPDNPQGCVAVVVGNEIVEKSRWPFPYTDRLNIVVARETKVHGRWTGDTVVSAAVPLQAAYNASWSAIVEHMKLAGNARLMSPMGALDQIDELTDLPSEVVEYVPVGGFRPDYLSPPQMPQWWIEQPTRLAQEIDDVLGSHDVSRGAAPPNIESGVGLSILVEQDDTPVGGMAKELAAAFGRYASLVLQTYAERVQHTRKARVETPGMAPKELDWTGADFMGQTRAIVPLDAVMPRSAEVAYARAAELLKFGLIPPDRPDIFAKVAELSRFDDFTEAVNPDIDKARRENHEMSVGQIMLPATFDQHRVHIGEHNAFRKSSAYERLPDDQRMVVDEHVQAHEVLEAEEQARLLAQAQQSMALAMAAKGDEPDMEPAAAELGVVPAEGPAEPERNGTPEAPDAPPSEETPIQ